jgi:hypothetical protein
MFSGMALLRGAYCETKDTVVWTELMASIFLSSVAFTFVRL